MKQIKEQSIKMIRDYLLNSVLPARDVMQIIKLLDESEDIKPVNNKKNRL